MKDTSPTIAADLRQLLADLARRGVRLSTRGDVLQCDAPRGGLTADARAQLSARKGEIIAFLDQQAAPAVAESAVRRIAPARPGTPVPLSFAQRRLWMQTQLDGASTAYNMRIALALHGALDGAALDSAVAAVVRRHAVLRTAFTARAGQPVQIVADDVDVAVTRLDLRALAEAERAAELDRVMERAARTPFDLTRAPLVRIGLVAMAPGEHVLLVTLHHLVGDGASLAILAGEIRELYAAAREGRAPRLPELPVQYTEFAAWQRQSLDDERLAALRSYWVETLAGAPPLLELPTDRPRTASAGAHGEIHSFHLPAELADELRALARASGTTLFMTLLAGFAALLARYSNQSDLVIGCPISLRTHDELEPLIGMFVNSLAMRIRVQDNPTFHDLLAHVREVASDAYAHSDLPLDQLVEALNPDRSLSHHPVYQTMFIHDNAPVALPEVAGLRFDILAHTAFDAKFDLMLSMSELPDGIRGVWEYRAALFDRATIERATEHLRVLLRAMVVEPRGRVMQAPLLTAAERRRTLQAWSHNGRARAIERTILELLDERIAAAPGATAVRFADSACSYAELDGRARRLARHLRRLGVRPGDRVAVLLPRSLELVAGLLAVLRAGAAYIPLDPSYPGERIADQLDDAGPAALVTTAALAAALPRATAPVVRVDADAEAIARAEAELPPARRALDEPAYLMYTSGSTGRPKAAIVTHGGLSNYLSWSAEAYGMAAGTRAAVSTSIAFDATITTLWSPLVAGATVVLLPEGAEIEALAALLQSDDGVDVVKLTPSHIDALRAHTGDAVRAGGARTLVIGGEQLLAEHVAWCQRVAPRARVVNEYGPTETVVGCCIHEIAPGGATPDIVPIGRPIDNTELYVLNPWLEPVPIGVPGELYIGGAGVALGYHQRPELTAEKFVDHPFARRPGARLYRTGDRAVWSADGCLRFRGRADDQVKVRGFRVELGEIDAQLARHPAVREAVTVVRDATHGRQQLVSYVVAARPALTADALRKDLSARLPEHMVPSVVVFLPQLPLTPNGKIDRTALPAPELGHGSGGGLPTGAMERELAALWAEVLGRGEIRRDDNFFELGGDSILGIQLVARARERGIQLVPRQLFENQTLAQLAAVARRDERTAAAQGPVSGPLGLAPIQRWFFDEHPVEPHHFNQSVLLEVPAGIDAAALGRALGQLFAHHDLLRARFTAGETGVRAEIAPPGPVELAITDLSHQPRVEQSARLQALIAEDQASLRLDHGALFMPRLFRLGPQQPGRLLLTAHHLVVDGVSWRILLEDLLRAYQAEAAGTRAALPAKTTAYGAWVERLTAWAGSADAAAEVARWTAVPDGPAAQLRLDHPYDADHNRAGYTAERTRSLSEADTRALRDASRAAYNVNLQEVLLAALVLALSETGERGTVTLDVEGHGREDLFDGIDVSRTVGWFASMFPVHLPLPPDRDPVAALTVVKEQLRAIPHAGLGFGVLRYLSPDPAVRAALAAAPAAQIRFNYFGQLDGGEPPAPGFALAAERCEPLRSPLCRRRHLLDINAWIHDGRLAMAWTYSQRQLEAPTVEALADRMVAALADIARICAAAATRHYTPSDFPDVALSQHSLDQLLADIARANEKD